jgi:copper chaperone
MYELQVEKMSCGGCASRVTRTIMAVDDAATVDIDLKNKTVRVVTDAPLDEVTTAITQAGFPAKARA